MGIETEKISQKVTLEKLAEKAESAAVEKEPQNEELSPAMLSFEKDHIGIDELVGFDPEWELATIRKMVAETEEKYHHHVKKHFMENFRERLKGFRINMARAQTEMENMLRENKDANRPDLVNKLDQIIKKNGVQSQGSHFLSALGKYLEEHNAVSSAITTYKDRFGASWESSLFQDLFDSPPVGKIEIDVLPNALYFRIFDPTDFVNAYSYGKKEEEREKSIQMARSSGGARLRSKTYPKIPLLEDRVIIENSTLIADSSEGIKIHEEEHTIHDFYPTSSFVRQERSALETFDPRETNPLLKFDGVMRKWALHYIIKSRSHAKDEILAYLKIPDSNIEDVRNTMTDDEGLYNYLKNWGLDQDFKKEVVGHINSLGAKIEGTDGKILSEDEIRDRLGVIITNAWNNEYKVSLNKAFDVLQHLLKLYGDTQENRAMILRILSQEPLEKWPRLSRILS